MAKKKLPNQLSASEQPAPAETPDKPAPKAFELNELEVEGLSNLFMRRQQLQEALGMLQKKINDACANFALAKGEKPAKDYLFDREQKKLTFVE